MNGVPYIDVYTLSPRRELSYIESFLERFTDRKLIEDREDEELMILPIEKVGLSNLGLEDYEWVRAKTLSHSLNFGLSDRSKCFSMYLNSTYPGIDQVMISFTADGLIIFGLSIYEFSDENQENDNYDFAYEQMKFLEEEFEGISSYVGLESPPSNTQKEFLNERKIWNKDNR